MLLVQILLNGILLGGLYGLMALGMGLVWGVLNIVNLAHGAFIMMGGYAVYFPYTLPGVDPRILYAVTFGFGAALAGAAGGLYGLVSQISPYVGATLTAKSFVIAIIGGLQNPLGAIVGGMIIGIAEALCALYISPTMVD